MRAGNVRIDHLSGLIEGSGPAIPRFLFYRGPAWPDSATWRTDEISQDVWLKVDYFAMTRRKYSTYSVWIRIDTLVSPKIIRPPQNF